MTKQEFKTIKTIIYACSHSVWSGGMRVAHADADRVISALEDIFADELGVEREIPLYKIWKKEDDEKRKLEATQAKAEAENESTSNQSKSLRAFWMRLIRKVSKET